MAILPEGKQGNSSRQMVPVGAMEIKRFTPLDNQRKQLSNDE